MQLSQVTHQGHPLRGNSRPEPHEVADTCPAWLKVWLASLNRSEVLADPIAAKIKQSGYEDHLRAMLSTAKAGTAVGRLEEHLARKIGDAEAHDAIKRFLHDACAVARVATFLDTTRTSEILEIWGQLAGKARRLAKALRKHRHLLPPIDGGLAAIPGLRWTTPTLMDLLSADCAPPANVLESYAGRLEKEAETFRARKAKRVAPPNIKRLFIDHISSVAQKLFGQVPVRLIAGMVSGLTGEKVSDSTVAKRIGKERHKLSS